MSETTTPTRILLVEDDVKLAALVKTYLTQHGFSVYVEPRGDDALATIARVSPDVVILDIMLPGVDGLTVCRRARESFTGPILMLTAQDEDLDEVVGLEVGADDYLTKPVRPRVLLARIRAQLRRSEQQSLTTVASSTHKIEIGTILIDAGQRSVILEGKVIGLTNAEFELLWLLAQHAGQPVSREVLYQELRGIAHDGLDRSIDLRISHLRTKLGDTSAVIIKSVRGVGYQLATPS